MIKLGILASTNATDMQAIIDEIEQGTLDAEIGVVIVNKEKCGAVDRAQKHEIPAVCIPSKELSREEYDKKVDAVLKEHEVELVLLIGYMRILSPWLVKQWKYKIMNIHPSLLPKFSGGMDLNVHQEVLDAGEKITGATLHFVDEGTDSGPIILQKEVQINDDETAQSLKSKVQIIEQEIILEGIRLFQDGKIHVENNVVKVDE